MKLSISEAARRAAVRRTTIYRKIDAGKLAKETDESGNPVIDLAELARLWPHAVTDPGHKPATARDTPVQGNGTAALHELIAILKRDKERLELELDRARVEARENIERERAERDRILTLLETAQRRLGPPRRSWFARLTGH